MVPARRRAPNPSDLLGIPSLLRKVQPSGPTVRGARSDRSVSNRSTVLTRPNPLRALLACAAVWISASGCGDRSSPVLHLEANGSVRISPARIVVDDGGTATLDAVLRDRSGQVVSELPAGASLSWTTFSSAIARIDGSGLGAQVTALKPGQTTVQVSLGSLTATADVVVDQVPAQIIKVGPPVALGLAGEFVPDRPRVQVLDRHGSPVPDATVRFQVTQGGGTVDRTTVRTDGFGFAETGWLLGPDLGIQALEAGVDDVATTQLFSYVNGDLSSVSFKATSPGRMDGVAGQPVQEMLEVRARDAQGRPVMGVGVEWIASDGTLLPTSPVTGSDGRARARWVLGSQAGEQSASVRLTLPQEYAPASGVAQDVSVIFQAEAAPTVPVEMSALPGQLVLELGAAARVSVAVRDNFGNAIDNFGAVSWTFADPSIASVTASGSGDDLFTGIRIGSTQAIAQVGALTDTIDVLVQPVADTGGGGGSGSSVFLSLSPPNLSITVGATGELALLAQDGAGNPLPANDALWVSDDPAVATVDAFGRVVGQSEGTTTIHATLGTVSTSGTVQVTAEPETPSSGGPPLPVTDLRAVDSGSTWVEVAFTASNDGTGEPAAHEIRFADAPIGWGWGQATRVTSGACASGFVPGFVGEQVTCRINGLEPGRTYDAQMVVWREDSDLRIYSPLSNVARGTTQGDGSGGGVVTVEVVPSTVTLSTGGTRLFEARAYDGSGERVQGVTATWSSTNDGVVQVDGSGFVTAVEAGAASIRATINGRTGTAAVLVVDGQVPDPSISTVTVTPSTSSLSVGQTSSLTATARTSSGSAIEGVSFSWSSADPSVATVDGSGQVTAVAAGTATILASAGGQIGSAQVTVTGSGGGGTPVRLELTPSSSILAVGGSVQLTARLLDAAGVLVPGVAVQWSSNDVGVAGVDANGLVQAWGPGNATITASTTGFTATADITVSQPSPATVWFAEDWAYASRDAMLASPTVTNTSTYGGDVELLTGLTGTPTGFTNAMRVRFLPNQGQEPQAGVSVTLPAADQDRPREMWLEFYARFSTNWKTDGPYGGNPDHKFLFLFDQDPSGTRRWESNIGVFGSQIGTYIAGNGVNRDFSPNIQSLWNGQWHRFRYHARMDANGVWEVDIDGQKFQWPGGNSDFGSQYYFKFVSLSANLNRGTDRNMTLDYGPVTVYTSHPGW